jgi:quercetin dioxygenase-like cupin family protein
MLRAVLGGLLVLLAACAATIHDLPASPDFVVEQLAARSVEHLPDGAVYWRVETFPSLAAAQAAAGPFSLTADASGQSWLFTLGRAGERTPGAAFIAEIGPVPRVTAARYTLRVNHAHAPPGSATSVHMHPGSEAFYVLRGQLTQRTMHGTAHADAGETMNGHAPGAVMQLVSTGSENLDQLVLFVVDANQPFSSPASFAR